MARRARWIRMGSVEAHELRAACAGLCAAQARDAAPIVLWACAKPSMVEIAADARRAYHFAVIAPLHVAPGLAARWPAWALSPAVAAYRDCGVQAYLDGSDVFLHGRRIGNGRAEAIGERIVIASILECGASPRVCGAGTPHFRVWLREGLGLAITQWGSGGDAPAERSLEAALRRRIEAQHNWEFETAWPTPIERAAMRDARREPLQPIFS